MTGQPNIRAAFFATARARIISALVIVMLLLAIVELAIKIRTDYFNTLTAEGQAKQNVTKEIRIVPSANRTDGDQRKVDTDGMPLRERRPDPFAPYEK
jgi:hypothetical protein